MNALMEAYIQKRLDQPTVILPFRIIIDNIIRNGRESVMTKCEIETVFNKERNMFGVQTFRRDYVMRQSGNRNNAINEIDEKFFIRPEYLEGLDGVELKQISERINSHYKKIFDARVHFLENIKGYKNKDIIEKKYFIEQLLVNIETDRRGQTFEISSFAILKTFYKCRGFELNRFSTVYANDGGVDFSGQNAIYQVTGSMTPKKFEEDIAKAPLKNRIFVYKEVTKNFDMNLFNNELVVDNINLDDLRDTLNYLERKSPERNLNRVIDVIIEEFNREYYIF